MNDKRQTVTEDEIMTMARAMPQDVQPESDLWPVIAAAIDAKPELGAGRWPRLFAQAAAVLLLVGASSGLTWLTMQDSETIVPSSGGSEGLTFVSVSGSFGSDYVLGPDFHDARDGLLVRLDEELDKLSPETQADVHKNIESIRVAIAEINQALANEPDNALLQELLINAYKEELQVLRRVDDVAGSVMRRTDI